MTKKGSSTQTESQKLSNQSRLYVPEPPFRPGDTPDYSHISVPADHTPVRPDPLCDAYDTVEHALRAMDERMFTMQRQGKMSFYMKSTGEEAVSVGHALALRNDDMTFPTYRQQGILLARGASMKEMMCQVLSNSGDPLDGKSIPVLYSFKKHGFFSISGNLGMHY